MYTHICTSSSPLCFKTNWKIKQLHQHMKSKTAPSPVGCQFYLFMYHLNFFILNPWFRHIYPHSHWWHHTTSPMGKIALKLLAKLSLPHKEGVGINRERGFLLIFVCLFVLLSKLTIRTSVFSSFGRIERGKGGMPELDTLIG